MSMPTDAAANVGYGIIVLNKTFLDADDENYTEN
jgi:hypothetical protein